MSRALYERLAQPRRMWNGSHYFHKKHNIYFTYYWKDCGRITSIWKQLEQLKCLVWEIQPSRGEKLYLFSGMFNLVPSGQALEKAAKDVWLRQLLLTTSPCLLAYYRAISAAYHFILQNVMLERSSTACIIYYIIYYINYNHFNKTFIEKWTRSSISMDFVEKWQRTNVSFNKKWSPVTK